MDKILTSGQVVRDFTDLGHVGKLTVFNDSVAQCSGFSAVEDSHPSRHDNIFGAAWTRGIYRYVVQCSECSLEFLLTTNINHVPER